MNEQKKTETAQPTAAAPQAPAAPAAPTTVVVAQPEDNFWSDTLRTAGHYALVTAAIAGTIVVVSLAAEGIRRAAGWDNDPVNA